MTYLYINKYRYFTCNIIRTGSSEYLFPKWTLAVCCLLYACRSTCLCGMTAAPCLAASPSRSVKVIEGLSHYESQRVHGTMKCPEP